MAANTIWNLFPVLKIRPEDVTVYPCTLNFSAPIIAGKYVFSEDTTPSKVFGKLLQKQSGVIAGIMISANCSEEDFTRNVDEPLKLQIIHDGNRTPVNLAPFPFTNFSQSENFQLEWDCSGNTIKQEESFRLGITGNVGQIANMTSNELKLQVVFNFMRVDSDKLRTLLK